MEKTNDKNDCYISNLDLYKPEHLHNEFVTLFNSVTDVDRCIQFSQICECVNSLTKDKVTSKQICIAPNGSKEKHSNQ